MDKEDIPHGSATGQMATLNLICQPLSNSYSKDKNI